MVNYDKYRPGSIRRIKLKDFVTYDDVEFFPGPNLNVIVGPNGTGKSSLVCAICLGLGGNLNLLGRATQPREFIKHHKESAEIEIELHNPDGEPTIIRRIIKYEQSEYYMNGKKSSAKAVKEASSAFNIQLDNLCQFLPQDMVVEFAKCDSKKLLEQTQKAIGSEDMIQKQRYLEDLQERMGSFDKEITRRANEIARETGLNADVEPTIRRHEERENIKVELKSKKRLQLRLKFDEAVERYKEAKDERERTKNEYQQLQDSVEEFGQELERHERKKADATKLKDRKVREVDDAMKSMTTKHAALEKLDEQVRIKKTQINACEKRMKEHEKKVQKLRAAVQTAEEEHAKAEEALDREEMHMQEAGEKLQEKHRKVKASIRDCVEKANDCKAQSDDIGNEVKRIEQDLKRLNDVKEQKLSALRKSRENEHTYEAVMWLRENKDRFKMEVFEPVILTVSADDIKVASMVEKVTSSKFQKAFVVQCEEDQDTFLRTVRDAKNLRVNLLLAPPTITTRTMTEEWKNLGVKGFLLDYYTAPDAVKRALAVQCKHNEIAVVSGRPDPRVMAKAGINLYFTEEAMYSVRSTRDGKGMYKTELLSRARNFSVGDDSTEDKTEMENRRRTLMNEKRQLDSDADKYLKEEDKLRGDLSSITSMLDGVKKLRTAKTRAEQQLENAKNRLQAAESENVSEAEWRRLDNQRKSSVNMLAQHSLEVVAAIEDVCTLSEQVPILEIQAAVAAAGYEAVTQRFEEQHTREEELRKAKEDANRLYNQCKERLKSIKEQGNAAGGLVDGDEYTEMLGIFPTLDVLENAIADDEARLSSMSEVDQQVLREYEERKRNIERLEAQLSARQAEMHDATANLEQLKQEWLGPLRTMISKISEKFSEYFSGIDCTGEVRLAESEKFSEYGIDIMVQFRFSEKLSRLTAHQQSGGERSVSTILYLMALQGQSVCPFRVVDEINQGMDARNERAVFATIAKVAAEPDTSQYFLITPKLLPKLTYDENMTVLCVFNGAHMLPHAEWNVSKFLRLRAAIPA